MTYLVALSGTVFAFGGLNVTSVEFLVSRWWILLPGAIAIALLGTLWPMWRFGDAGGSRYFLPTVTHVAILLILAIGVAKELME